MLRYINLCWAASTTPWGMSASQPAFPRSWSCIFLWCYGSEAHDYKTFSVSGLFFFLTRTIMFPCPHRGPPKIPGEAHLVHLAFSTDLCQCLKSWRFMRSRSDFTRARVSRPALVGACAGLPWGFIQREGVSCSALAVIVFPCGISSPKF